MIRFTRIIVPLYLCESVQLELEVVYKSVYNYDVDGVTMVDDDGRHNIPKAAYDLMILGSAFDIEEKIQEAIEEAIADREHQIAA